MGEFDKYLDAHRADEVAEAELLSVEGSKGRQLISEYVSRLRACGFTPTPIYIELYDSATERARFMKKAVQIHRTYYQYLGDGWPLDNGYQVDGDGGAHYISGVGIVTGARRKGLLPAGKQIHRAGQYVFGSGINYTDHDIVTAREEPPPAGAFIVERAPDNSDQEFAWWSRRGSDLAALFTRMTAS